MWRKMNDWYILLSCLLLMFFSLARAESLTSGDFTYELVEDNAVITAWAGTETVLVVPDMLDEHTVTGIGDYAFGSYNVSKVKTIPESVSLPSSITNIGEGAFARCQQLSSINMPEGLTTIGVAAFTGCSSLKTINLPACLTEIGRSAFWSCTALSSVELPAGLITLSESLFRKCTSLTEITIPQDVESFGTSCFLGCTALKTVTIQGSKVTSLGTNCFYGCTKLSFEIPSTVTEIGAACFFNCKLLASIGIPSGVTELKKNCFKKCTTVEAVTIPENVQAVGEACFASCTALQSVTIDSDETTFADNAFQNCSENLKFASGDGLSSRFLNGDSDSTMEVTGFSGTITELVIPEKLAGVKVTNISAGAFSGCTELTSVSLSESVTNIGSGAFSECTSLAEVCIIGSETQIVEDAFDGCSDDLLLYVQTGSAARRFARSKGITYIVYLDPIDDATLELPASMRAIGERAFAGMRIKTVICPENLTTIGKEAFADSAIREIYFPGSTQNKLVIADDAFIGCDFHKLVIHTSKGSSAAAWAENKGITTIP